MTDAELQDLVHDNPTLFHMAERGAWPAIQRHGLLSTSALLDLYGITGAARVALEATRRPDTATLTRPGLPDIAIRDQKPMTDRALERCLTGDMTPPDWYRLLNGKVFFWLSEARLAKLLGARPYRDVEHDVLELDTTRLVAAYHDRITLSRINSGSTIRKAAPRGPDTFRNIADYPIRPGRERAVELAVTGGVPDIARFVIRVIRRRAAPA
ncbi:MAG: DUF7002 family protein [Janthinobacterium lividum]